MADEISSSALGDVKHLSPAVRGDWAEITAALWLIEQGYEVFKNIRNTGPIDLMTYKMGRMRMIDVKFYYVSLEQGHIIGNANAGTKENKKRQDGVERLLVSQHGVCAFSTAEMSAKYQSITGLVPKKRGVGRPRLQRKYPELPAYPERDEYPIRTSTSLNPIYGSARDVVSG